jgi:inner membrane transporter RhtA
MPQSRNASFWWAIASVLVAMMAIQSGASLAKTLFPIIGPEGTTALRVGFAALILFLVFQPWKKWPAKQDQKALWFYGVCLGGMNLMFYLAIERIPLGIAVALEFTGPLAVALLSSKRKLDLLWVALAMAGIALLLPWQTEATALDPAGVALALGAGACWAGYIIFGQKTGSAVHGGTAVALGMAVAALFLFPIGLASAGSSLFSWTVLPFAFAVALLSSAIPYSLEMVALKRLPAQSFSILMSLEPAIAALAALIILAEQLSLLQWLAIFAVIAASLGSSLTARKTPAPEMVT